jgi:two-component system OmpR family sensor kinase
MNRLWVRFGLAFASVVIVVLLILGLATRLALTYDDELGPGAPAEVQEYFRQLRRSNGPFPMTGVIIVVGVVAISAGVWMSKTLSAPLEELEEEAIGMQDLSRRVTVRGTAEVQAVADRFNQMAQQLEEEEDLRRNLLVDVSHELRNPLHVIAGNLQALLDDVYPLTKEEIARLSDQTRHLTTLVDDLHDVAQAEAHQLNLDKRSTDLVVLVKETASAFQPVAAAQGVTLRVELLGTIPSSVDVDRDRIRQILNNLLSNALRHTPTAGEIWVTVQQLQQAFCISIRDTGSGIAAQHLDRVFDRFYRTDDGRSREKGGTGLGLAIVRALTDAHGGQVSVASEGPGKGSTFTIQLPLAN